MGGKNFNFENMLSGGNEENKPKEAQSNNVEIEDKRNAGDRGKNKLSDIAMREGSKEPFTFHIYDRDAELIRAICAHENISQRKFLEAFIDKLMKEKEETIKLALEKYREKNTIRNNSIFD